MNKAFKTKHRARSVHLAKRRELKRTIKRALINCADCGDNRLKCYCLAA